MDSSARGGSEQDYRTLIVAVAARGDRVAFARLFEYFAPRVKMWMLRSGATETAAEELSQDVMLAVWLKAHLYDPSLSGASTWIFTIARNLRIDRLRRERHPATLLPDPTDDPVPPPQAERLIAAAEREHRLREALDALSPEQSAVIQMAFFQDKPHSEIERDLGIPLGTVKSRLRLAVARLRAALGDIA